MRLPKEAIRELFLHMEWADGEVWSAVLACEAARDDVVLRGLLLHLHVVQRAFVAVWKKEPVAFPDPAHFPSIADLHAWTTSYYAGANAFLEGVEEAALDRQVVMPWAEQLAARLGRMPEAPTLCETMLQVTSHSTYHRGQINARLRSVGGEPPLVDYIAWIWFGRPAPRPHATVAGA
jgi:uncharacterized damage-inducible protein DinB